MSSKRHLRRKRCESKHRHPTEAAASDALRSIKRRSDFRGGTLGVYHCVFCKGWHVGHVMRQPEVGHKGRRP